MDTEPGGYSPWGFKESDMTELLTFYSLDISFRKVGWEKRGRENVNEVEAFIARNCKVWHKESFSHESDWTLSKSLHKMNVERVWRKGNALALLVGMYIDTATMEDGMEIPLKTRNQTTTWPSNPSLRHLPCGNQNWKRRINPNVYCIYNSRNMGAT